MCKTDEKCRRFGKMANAYKTLDGKPQRNRLRGGDVSANWKIKLKLIQEIPVEVSLDNDQLDAHLLCFTIRPIQSSTCFEYYMLIIRGLIALM